MKINIKLSSPYKTFKINHLVLNKSAKRQTTEDKSITTFSVF